MVSRILGRVVKSVSGLHEAAFWLAGFSILSQILAFFRDRLLAANFGAGSELDIYYTAFRIPDFIFVTLGSLVSISVLVPMFSKKATGDSSSMRAYVNSVFTSFSGLIIIGCAFAFILMPYLVPFLFKGFPSEGIAQIIKFSRILLLSPLLLGFSNFFGALVQYEKRFLLYSLSPLFYNLGIIFGTVLGAKDFGVTAVVWGVVFGASLHLLIPASFMFFCGRIPKFTLHIKWAEVRETALISIPRALALSATQITGIAFTAIAALLGVGAVAVWNLAYNLQSVPLSIIGVSYSLAAFPTLSEHYAQKNISECSRHIGAGLRHIVFWTLIFSALFISLRAHIVRVVLGTGVFDWTDTRLTAAVMALFALSFVFQSVQLFLIRTHYALGRTKIPLIFGMSGAILTVALAYIFHLGFFSGTISWLGSFLEVGGLAAEKVIILPLAFSLGALFSAAGLWLFLDKKIKESVGHDLRKSFGETLLAALVIWTVTYYSMRIFDNFFSLESLVGVLSHALVSGLLGIGAGVIVLWFTKNKEFYEYKKLLHHRPH